MESKVDESKGDENEQTANNACVQLVESKLDDEQSMAKVPLNHESGELNMSESIRIKLEMSKAKQEEEEQKLEELMNSTLMVNDAVVVEPVKHHPLKGCLFGVFFALGMCMANVFIKMSPSLDGANHAITRYSVQLVAMIFFVKKNNLNILGPKEHRALLWLRGVVGCAAVMVGFFAIKYLNVSDVETVTNSCVLITALLARVFLKEKISISYIFALILTIAGVIFLIRPSFLFGIERMSSRQLDLVAVSNETIDYPPLNETLLRFYRISTGSNRSDLNVTSDGQTYGQLRSSRSVKTHLNRTVYETILGFVLVFISAICMSSSQVAIRKLVHFDKVHFSVTSMYPAIVGLPIALVMSVVLDLVDTSSRTDNDGINLISIQILFSILSAICGTVALVCLNIALHYEDATKIAMVKMMGVVFSFVLQYLFLDITADLLGILGAAFILMGTLSVILFKRFEGFLLKSSSPFRVFAIKF